MSEQFFTELRQQGSVVVRVIPNASKTAIGEKMENGIWKVRVNAIPEKNKANRALLEFLQQEGNISAFIRHGQKSRTKYLELQMA